MLDSFREIKSQAKANLHSLMELLMRAHFQKINFKTMECTNSLMAENTRDIGIMVKWMVLAI